MAPFPERSLPRTKKSILDRARRGSERMPQKRLSDSVAHRMDNRRMILRFAFGTSDCHPRRGQSLIRPGPPNSSRRRLRPLSLVVFVTSKKGRGSSTLDQSMSQVPLGRKNPPARSLLAAGHPGCVAVDKGRARCHARVPGAPHSGVGIGGRRRSPIGPGLQPCHQRIGSRGDRGPHRLCFNT